MVLDGAGSPAGLDSGCFHSVAWYARTLGGLLAGAIADRRLSLTEALAVSIDAVNAAHRGTCDLANPHSPSATVLVARAAGDRLEYLVLSDSTLIVELADDDPLIVTDARLAGVYGKLDAPARLPPLGSGDLAADLFEHVRKLAAYRNQPGGFWVASINPAAATQALTGSVPLDQVEAVALLSDGATRTADRFGLSTWADVLAVLRKDGPQELIRRTREAEAGDPRGERWSRSKATDDATAAYWTLRN
ncbi:MAG: hypothetical protein JWN52_3831 [Actinomycetia bacterium]|nr:hypothetical protein [Actinomycetes bacterium]